MKKTLTLFLIAALLLSSCGDTSETTGDTTASDTTTVTPSADDELSKRALVDDGLGSPDLGGYEFRIIADTNASGVNWRYVDAEEMTGDIVMDAVYKRNSDIEQRFNCEISLLHTDNAADLRTWVQTAVTAGDDAFDLYHSHVIQAGIAAVSNIFVNWCDMPNVDLTKPWWSQTITETLTYKDQLYLAVGDFALSSIGQTWCTFYNGTLGADYGMGSYFDTVNEGKWTFDFMLNLAKDAYKDLNGNGEMDNDDQYGYLTQHQSSINAFLWAFDNPILMKDGDEMEFVYNTEKLADITEKLITSFRHGDVGIRTDVTYVSPKNGSNHNYNVDMFSESKAVFTHGVISQSLDYFREMEDNYSILPYPKWDAEQAEYHTMSDGSHAIMAVPVTVPMDKREAVGTVIEALNAESWKHVVPAYYDTALKVKGTRDDESIAMLDMIVNSRVFDMGYIYSGGIGPGFALQMLFTNDDTNIQSYLAANASAFEAHYEKVFASFEQE